jgi:hypothetical protein
MSREHRPPAGGSDDGAFDWWKVADIAVWVAVTIVAVIAIEWLAGYMIREQVTRGAERILARTAKADTPPE